MVTIILLVDVTTLLSVINQKKMISKILLTLIFLLSIHTAKSQSTQPKLTGIVLDSVNNQPIAYATLILKESKSDIAKKAIPKADGVFTFAGLKPVEYLLTVAAQGFETRNIKINLDNTTKGVKDLGRLHMITAVQSLKEVVVKENKPLTTQGIDRISYNIQADPESKTSNVLEMMRKVPLLSVDGDNTVRLRGNTNYKIFINGKPSSILERNPQDVLRNMSASGSDKVEVITTVPAKYDAEALDGIINVITKTRMSDGYSGNVNTSDRFLAGGPGSGGSITFKSGKMGVSGFMGGSLFDSPPVTNSFKRYTSNTTLLQTANIKSNSKNGYFGLDLSYEIDSLNLLSGQFNIGRNHNHINSDLNSLLDYPDRSYRLIGKNALTGANFDASLNHQIGFRSSKNQLLTFSYRILKASNNRSGDFDVTDVVSSQAPDYLQKNNEQSLEQSFQIDYSHPFKKMTMEAGIKGIIRNNKSSFLYDTLSIDQISLVYEGFSNRLDNTQEIFGIYNSYLYNIKDWAFKAGLRLEHATIDADFISNNSQIKRLFLDYIPSLSIQKKLKNNTNMIFGYSRKVRRPEIQHLNPFIDRSNPNFISSGNPNLTPASSSSFQISYSSFKKLSLNIRLNYDLNSKMVLSTVAYDAVDNITRSTLENSGYLRMVGANVYISYPFTSKWNASSNLTTIYGRMEGLVNDMVIRNQMVMYYFSGSSSYRFDKGWTAVASVNFNGADINLQGIENSPFRGCGFSISKELIKNKFYFTTEISNPFSKYRNNSNTTNAANFYQERINQRYLRSFSISLNYRFGNLKSTFKKNQKGITNDDDGISPY
jgi:ferric enterobactin receptor